MTVVHQELQGPRRHAEKTSTGGRSLVHSDWRSGGMHQPTTRAHPGAAARAASQRPSRNADRTHSGNLPVGAEAALQRLGACRGEPVPGADHPPRLFRATDVMLAPHHMRGGAPQPHTRHSSACGPRAQAIHANLSPGHANRGHTCEAQPKESSAPRRRGPSSLSRPKVVRTLTTFGTRSIDSGQFQA